MRMRGLLTIVSCLSVLGLMLAGCAPAAAPTPTAKPEAPVPAKPTAAPAETARPAAPAATPKPAAEEPALAGGTLQTISNGNPPSYDIQQETTAFVVQAVSPAYNSLVKYDSIKGEIAGDLAQRWEVSDGGKVYTFYFQKGVKWHDGQPFSAEDAKASLERSVNPPRGTVSPRQKALSSIKQVEAVGEDTLKVTLQQPHPSFLEILSTGWEVVMPRHVIQNKGSMKKDVVGTGPFKFVRHDSGVVTELKKNDNYFVKGKPYLDGIRIYIIVDATTRFALLRTKRINMTPQRGLTPGQMELIDKEKLGINVARTEGNVRSQVIMRNDISPWNDVRVRRAIDIGFDRQEGIRVVSEGTGQIGGPLPPNHPAAIPLAELANLPGYRQPKDADVAEAKRLLAEAGYPNGFETHVLFRSGAEWERGAVYAKDQLARLGVRATVEGLEAGSYMQRLYEGRFVVSTLKLAIPAPEAGFILGETYLTGAGQNYAKFSDKEFDAMFEEQRQTMDAAKRKQLLLKMQQRLVELVPYHQSHWDSYFMGLWPEVRNYKPGLTLYDNLQYESVWLAK